MPAISVTGVRDRTVPPGDWDQDTYTTTSDGDVFYYTGASAITRVWAEAQGCDLPDLTLEQMQSVHAEITKDVFDVLGVDNSVNSRMSYGGTAPAQVRAQVERWKEILK